MTRAEIRQAEAVVSIFIERFLKLEVESRADFITTLDELDTSLAKGASIKMTKMDTQVTEELEKNICELFWPEMIGNLRRGRSPRGKK